MAGLFDMKGFFRIPHNPVAFVPGFFVIPRGSDVLSVVMEKRGVLGLQMTRAAVKGITTAVSFVTHLAARTDFTMGWFMGEANDMIMIGAEALARELTKDVGIPQLPQPASEPKAMLPFPNRGTLAGVTGRRAGMQTGGFAGKRGGFETGAVNAVDEFKRLQQSLGGSSRVRALAGSSPARVVVRGGRSSRQAA